MNNLENMIEIARNLACEALTETNCFAKLKLLVESANQYYLASQNADEPGVKVSLAYLAAFKVSEANLLKTTMISTDHKSHQLRNLNDTAPKEAITFGNRLLFEAHSRRISGLSKVNFLYLQQFLVILIYYTKRYQDRELFRVKMWLKIYF